MADNNIFVYTNKKWRKKCGTFFLFLFRSKSFFVRNISLEKWAVESALYSFLFYMGHPVYHAWKYSFLFFEYSTRFIFPRQNHSWVFILLKNCAITNRVTKGNKLRKLVKQFAVILAVERCNVSRECLLRVDQTQSVFS